MWAEWRLRSTYAYAHTVYEQSPPWTLYAGDQRPKESSHSHGERRQVRVCGQDGEGWSEFSVTVCPAVCICCFVGFAVYLCSFLLKYPNWTFFRHPTQDNVISMSIKRAYICNGYGSYHNVSCILLNLLPLPSNIRQYKTVCVFIYGNHVAWNQW